MISTRGRYAIRVILDIANNQKDGYVPMKDVASRQGLSLKYLEQILPTLTKNKILEGVQGKGGGYRLVKSLDQYTVGDVLRATEKDLAPVSCLATVQRSASAEASAVLLDIWEGLNEVNQQLP